MSSIYCYLTVFAGSFALLGVSGQALADPVDAYRGYVVAQGAGWELNIQPKHPMYMTFDEAEGIESAAVAPAAKNSGVVQFSSKTIIATFRETGACKVAGKSWTYPLDVEVKTGGKTHKGCGYLRWDNDILALIPAIDACLAKSKGKGPITWAQRRSDGVMVRLAAGDSKTTVCQVDQTGGKAMVVKAVTGKDIAPELGENKTMFYRAPAKNPGGECYDAPSVKDANGNHLGWIDGDEGC